jgi:hypothetical protein
MVALFDGYGNLIIRGMPGEKLGGGYNYRKSHARRQTGAIIARGSSQIGASKYNGTRHYCRLKADD